MPTDRPRATYRLQLGPDLDFAAAAALVDYLAALGVTHVYCSPVLEAKAGSTHGYDVADPTRLSAALGGEDGFRGLAEAARSRGLGLVVDVVPNHLGVGADNPLWENLLAEGQAGPAGRFFDVDWDPALPGATGKVVLPVLGAPYGEVLHGGELRIADEGEHPRLRYHEHSFPLAPATREALARRGSPEGVRGESGTWMRFHALLEGQHYRLVYWRAGSALVNYRRFFAINELAAVRVEDDDVFAHTHAKVLELVRSGLVEGLRLDHVDGLADPTGYLARLREAAGEDTWIVVEKILAPGEELPEWPVDGTTGYEFLAAAVGVNVATDAEDVLTETARAFDAWPSPGGLADAAARAKLEVLSGDLQADSERLVDRFWELAQNHVEVRDVTRTQCRAVLLATLTALDVYRVYTRPGEQATAADAARVRAAVAGSRAHTPQAPRFLWDFLEVFLLGQVSGTALHTETLRRFHQVASAATAKGIEDTLLYRQHRLAALNDVGVEPEHFGTAVEHFHALNARRAERHPLGLLTTATHDTKRGEDVRLRIAALSEVAADWAEAAQRWHARHRSGGGPPPPDPAAEYLCYQTLIGVWPPDGAPDLERLAGRVGDYLVKAAREDGRRTSWVDPDDAYEEGIVAFVRRLLDHEASATFLSELGTLARRTGEIAMVSGLAQTLLRITSPGVPDTYQGTELWDDSLVDPDNRRPVDFAARRHLLETLDSGPADLGELVANRADGRLKLWVLSRALRARAAHPDCFAPGGGYAPLAVRGAHAERIIAFARLGGNDAAVVLAPRLVGELVRDGTPPLGSVWADTLVELPHDLAGGHWVDVLGGPGSRPGPQIMLADTLAALPLAFLVRP